MRGGVITISISGWRMSARASSFFALAIARVCAVRSTMWLCASATVRVQLCSSVSLYLYIHT